MVVEKSGGAGHPPIYQIFPEKGCKLPPFCPPTKRCNRFRKQGHQCRRGCKCTTKGTHSFAPRIIRLGTITGIVSS